MDWYLALEMSLNWWRLLKRTLANSGEKDQKSVVQRSWEDLLGIMVIISENFPVDRLAESSTAEVDPFLGAVRVISTGSYEGTLLLNKKTVFPLKERKLPGNNVFFDHLFHMTLRLFGPTIRKRWNLQTVELKNQLIASFDEKFGKDMFDNGLLLKRAAKHLKTVRDQYRRALKDNPKYDRPAMIPPMEWNEIVEDAKEKRLCEDRGNEAAQSKKRLQDTSVATKARLEKFGQHKLGSGGYMNLQSQLVLNLMAKKLLDLPPAEELKDIYKAFDEYMAAVLCLPVNIPGTAFARGFKARKTLIKKIYECIEDKRQHPEVNRKDLLTKLVKEGNHSDEIIADLILFLLFAGFETSANAMAFAVKFLTENPQALKEITVSGKKLE